MEYYMILNGNQAGPFTKEELLAQGLTKNTPVWHSGMPDWRPASEVADLEDLFAADHSAPEAGSNPYARESQQAPQSGPYRQNNGWQQSWYQGPSGVPHTNWMPWAIVATVLNICSCIGLVFGIIGIVHASKANRWYDMGNDVQGDANNSTAKIMTIIALVFAGVGIIGNILYMVFYGAAIFSSALLN